MPGEAWGSFAAALDGDVIVDVEGVEDGTGASSALGPTGGPTDAVPTAFFEAAPVPDRPEGFLVVAASGVVLRARAAVPADGRFAAAGPAVAGAFFAAAAGFAAARFFAVAAFVAAFGAGAALAPTRVATFDAAFFALALPEGAFAAVFFATTFEPSFFAAGAFLVAAVFAAVFFAAADAVFALPFAFFFAETLAIASPPGGAETGSPPF